MLFFFSFGAFANRNLMQVASFLFIEMVLSYIAHPGAVRWMIMRAAARVDVKITCPEFFSSLIKGFIRSFTSEQILVKNALKVLKDIIFYRVIGVYCDNQGYFGIYEGLANIRGVRITNKN